MERLHKRRPKHRLGRLVRTSRVKGVNDSLFLVRIIDGRILGTPANPKNRKGAGNIVQVLNHLFGEEVWIS